jgi:hypothetical protein
VLRLDGALDGVKSSDGKIQSGVKPPQSKKQGSGISRGDAEGWDRVPQLPKTFCGREGVLECSGLTELGMGESAPMGKSKAVSSHRNPRKKDPESHAKARKVGDRPSAAVAQDVLWP